MTNFTSNKPRMFDNGVWRDLDQPAPQEIPVDLTVNGETWLTFMCSPFQIEYLAVGFLYNEQIIQSTRDLAHVSICDNLQNVDIWLNYSVEKPGNWVKTSGCAGGQTSDTKVVETQSIIDEVICPEVILTQLSKLISSQKHYHITRGIHCSILTDGATMDVVAEDIGRHNTLDKLAGYMVLEPKQWARKIILTTGRVSSEMLQKSAHMGASLLVSRTSPTQASIRTANELQMTLIGYARRNQFIVYTHPERLANTMINAENAIIFC